jgi:hemoglobin/transferrin/lactoferrin receptor protein
MNYYPSDDIREDVLLAGRRGRRFSRRLLLFFVLNPALAWPQTSPEEVVVTARRQAEPVFGTPYSVQLISAQRIEEVSFRTVPDMFREVPGALVQKTAHGQGSPYIRGFTGYRNLFLVDGIRLNNATFRDGPNQYWNTVDPGLIERLEIVRGPGSVLYGSDAIGGTVHVITRSPRAYLADKSLQGDASYRYASGEDSHVTRAHLDIAVNERNGLLLGGSINQYGDIEAGSGNTLNNTGYDAYTLDAKWESLLSERWTGQLAYQQLTQDNVPRTHKTIHSVPFQGTTAGNERRRNLDQERELAYLKLLGDDAWGLQTLQLTLSWQQQEEKRDRLRSGDSQDSQGFEVESYGLSLVATRTTDTWGSFTAGLDYSRDEVNSSSSRNPIQGPVADDASYDWAGIYLQNRYELSAAIELTTGVRLGYFEADAGSIADPATGEAFSYSNDWTEPVASARLGWEALPDRLQLYAGISQGFRAPNLSDLTRFDSARSNEFEIPATDLDPEQFTSYELGARLRANGWEVEGSAYYTDIDDQITRVLTGNTSAEGTYEVTKANIGSGEIYGAELRASVAFNERWSAFAHAAYLNGNLDSQAVYGGQDISDKPSRLMPANYRLGLRYEQPAEKPWWVESELMRVADADELSFRDTLDTQRIPPGGTPDYWLWHIRGGMSLTDHLIINLALENILDENYRVHGSGQNETGRNTIITVNYQF